MSLGYGPFGRHSWGDDARRSDGYPARYCVRHKEKVTESWQLPPACRLGQSQPITDLAQR